jgi:thioredoxin reductase
MRTNCDVLIVGGGAGGLSAALVLARARRRVTVIDGGRPRNAPAAHLHGYLGRDGARPADLLSDGRAEAAGYGATGTVGQVRDVTTCEEGFRVTLEDGRRLTARRILLATGLVDRLPNIPGLSARWGRDILHCPYCHGHEVADQPLGVINAGPHAVHQATTVRQWSRDVVLFTNGTTLDDEAAATLDALRIAVVTAPISRVIVDCDRLTGVQLADGRVIARTAVFVAPNPVANDEAAAALGADTYQHRLGRFVTTDTTGRTSVPGVYAVGNVTDPAAQLITAAGDGSRAAIEINSDLIEEDAESAVRRAAGSDGRTARGHDERAHRRARRLSPGDMS